MITIKKGGLTYGETQILSELDLEIRKGEFVVICGESGSGKSSLIRILNGLIPELYEGDLTGEFDVLGKQLPIEDFNDYVKDLGVVFQNPKTQFFMNDVYSELGFSMENYGETREKMQNQIKKISEIFELVPYWKKSMHELSGGEKQRVAFSSACMMSHELFLLDEPSSNLDEKHIELIQNYLTWLKENKQTIIVAEHRLYYLMPMADRFVFMQNGQIIHDLTRAEMEALTPEEIKSLGLRSLTKPNLKNFAEINQIDSEINVNELACDNVTFSYKKNDSDINIEKTAFNSQKVTGIIGQNGAGKTTFSQLMTGILKPESGAIWFNKTKQTPRQLIKKSFLVMQDVNLQLFFETVEKEISAKAKRLDLFDLVVETLQLDDLLDRHPQSLSGGQKQRVAIATAVLSGKEVIIMDEPTSGLDLKHMLEVNDMIQTLKTFNVILLIISHDKEFINLCCDDVLEMKSGRLVKVSENFFN